MSFTEPILNPEAVPRSAYWKMVPSAREARREYARQRYRIPAVRDRTKKHQYMKGLRSGLIVQPRTTTLARNGIVLGADGEYAFVQEA